ncbi:MAG TPA: glycosyltransferase family 1 protein [Bryobacteraceae bacterium]|nr:glycosyltransferase family 1 protein [Bryobacteraceae bacterium]
MRFAVDAHAIGRHLTGNEVYIRSLLRAFAEQENASEFYAYISAREAQAWIPKHFPTRYVSPNPWPRLGWQLGRLVDHDRPDLLHVQYTAPLNVSVPVVVTVHDVSFLENPEYFRLSRRVQLRLTVARTIERAERVITVSSYSRDAILRHYDISPDKVRVVPNAASPEFRVIGRERAIASVQKKWGIGGPLVLSVGDLQPRKNQIGLIRAFASMLAARPSLKHHLVLAGQETWFAPKVRQEAQKSGYAHRIHFTGFVTDEELRQLYNACECFVFPSFYEGFGMPILEAMACGRAVLCSNTSAMPEVADGAGILFNPNDPEDIRRCMEDILLDPELKARQERLGLHRAAHFSWQKSARATLDIYKEVAEVRTSREKVRVSVPLAARPH